MGKDKIIGLIGGTGWASTAEYYRLINEKVNEKLGGLNFARCLIYSLNYGDVNAFNLKNDPEGVYGLLRDAAGRLQAAGADSLVLCANTLHQYAEKLEKEVPLRIIHIAEATARAIRADHFNKVGLLGTQQTMEMDFYTRKLSEQGIETIVPPAGERAFIEKTIRTELLRGIFSLDANTHFLSIIDELHSRGARGVVLGCTEIPLLIRQEQTGIKLYNTTEIHAGAIVEDYLSN